MGLFTSAVSSSAPTRPHLPHPPRTQQVSPVFGAPLFSSLSCLLLIAETSANLSFLHKIPQFDLNPILRPILEFANALAVKKTAKDHYISYTSLEF